MQQGFRRDASPVQAGAAEGILFNDSRFAAQLSGAYSGDVPRRSAAEIRLSKIPQSCFLFFLMMVGNPCAVIPSSSQIATPILFSP